jgi:membrane protein
MKITGFKKVFYYINDLVRKYIDDGCTMFAAAISYYTIFSIFPIILIVFSLSSAFFARSAFLDTIQDFVRENIPMISDFVLANIEGIIKNIVGIGALGLVFFVYGASSVFNAVEYAFLKIFKLERKKIWVSKLYGFLIIALIVVIALVTIGLSILFSYLTRNALSFFNTNSLVSSVIFRILTIIISLIFNFFLFITVYYFGIAKQMRFRQLWLGALAGALIWEGIKLGFVFYLNKYANYARIYGSIGSIIAFLFWIYISVMILLLGAEIIYFNVKKTRKHAQLKL